MVHKKIPDNRMNMEQSEYERLARYLSGDIPEKEAREIASRQARDPVFAETVRKFRLVWETREKRENPFTGRPPWEKLCKDIEIAESRVAHEVTEGKPWKGKKRPKQRNIGAYWLIRVAAMLLVGGLTGVFLVLFMGEQASEEGPAMQEVVTGKGQRSNIHLKDGSRIILNSVGRVSYAPDFDDEKREVHLEGEAYFDIARDGRPFFVYADDAVIEILGTEFTVRSYPDEDISVAVTGGSVKVRHREGFPDDAVYLEKGDVVYLPRAGEERLIVSRNVDLSRHTGWLTYHYSYSDTPLGEIARELERTYGVDIEFVDPELSLLRITADFEGDSIHEVLQVIQIVLEVRYEMTGRKILFSALPPDEKSDAIW